MKIELPHQWKEVIEGREIDPTTMTVEELFIEYCEWHGLIRWGRTLWGAMKEAQLYKHRQAMGPKEPKPVEPDIFGRKPNLTCHKCRRQVSYDHKGNCPFCGADEEHVYI